MQRPLIRIVRQHPVLFAVLAAHLLLWSLANQFISPHPDTIDHWVQSRFLSLGYYEHPPMVAWLLRGITTVLGSSEAALEIGAQLINLAILAATYALAARTFGRLAAGFTLAMLEATLYFSAGSTIFQIDQPMMLAWIASLWALLSYQRTGQGRWLLVMGLFAGLGGLSKYVMVLFYLGVGVYITLVPAARKEWRNPYQYLGGIVALLVVSPLVFWNSQNEWASFVYQLRKAVPEGTEIFGRHALNFTVGYLIIFSAPLIAWGALALFPRVRREGRGDSPFTLVLIMSLTPLAFFTLILLRGSFSDPKWANVSLLGFYMLAGAAAAERWRAGRRRGLFHALGWAHALNVALIALIFAHIYRPFLPVPPDKDPTRQVVGWRRTAEQVEALLAEREVPLPDYVLSIFYPLASQFALHLSNQPLTHSLERPARNLWSPLEELNERNTLMVCERNCAVHVARVESRAGLRLEIVGTVRTVWGGIERRRLSVYRVTGRIPRRGKRQRSGWAAADRDAVAAAIAPHRPILWEAAPAKPGPGEP